MTKYFGTYASQSEITDEFLERLRPAVREQTGTELDSTMLTRDDAGQSPESPRRQFGMDGPPPEPVAPTGDRHVVGQGQCDYGEEPHQADMAVFDFPMPMIRRHK